MGCVDKRVEQFPESGEEVMVGAHTEVVFSEGTGRIYSVRYTDGH